MAADNPRVTNAELAELFRGLDIRTQEILLLVENVRAEQLTETRKLWNAFGSIGGLDGIGNGVAEIAGMLEPLRNMVPPTTANELAPGVAEAVATIREALGGRRDINTNFGRLATDWDGRVGYIGEAQPPATCNPYQSEGLPA